MLNNNTRNHKTLANNSMGGKRGMVYLTHDLARKMRRRDLTNLKNTKEDKNVKGTIMCLVLAIWYLKCQEHMFIQVLSREACSTLVVFRNSK